MDKIIALIDSITESFTNNLIAEDRYRMILDGLQVTLLITLFAAILGTLLGGLVCWMRMSRRQWLRQTAKVYIELMRGTPVLVLLMLMYYVVMAPLDATGIVVAIVTFAMNTAAYISEMLRTTIQGIDRGQTEAGLALGFTPRQTFFKIVLPQVIKAVMPVYQGEVVSLLKGTSIVGYIAVGDMTRASDLIRSRTFDAFFPLIVTAIIYFLMAWLIGLLLQSLVQRQRVKAIIVAVVLMLFGLAGWLSTPETDATAEAADQSSVPPAFQALKGKNVAVIIGSIQDIAVTDMASDANILRMTSQTDLLAALENGKVDAAGGESLTLMFNKELLEKVDSVGAGLTPIPIAACYRLDNSELQQDFNSFLAEIRRDGTYQQILDRWSNADDPSAMAIPQQRGTGRILRVATFPAMPPFNFINSGKPSGLEPELLTEWANRRNWQLEYLIMDFAAQIPAVQAGKADMAMGAISVTEERQKQVLFSDGYIDSHIVLMTRKGEAGILSLTPDPIPEQSSPTRSLSPKGEGSGYLWSGLAILIMIIGGGTWFFLRRRRFTTLHSTPLSLGEGSGVRLVHLRKSYGSLEVLRDITVDIHRGEVISIIGPSGTGKSTLLRCLNLLEQPTGGSIVVDGEDILAKGYPVNRLRQKMGMVFQSFNLFEHKTVLENVIFAPCQLRRMPEEEARREGLALLRKVGLAEKADVYPSSLSGGQKQRVAIARALAMKPDVILFDEPTSALDPTMVGEVLSVIRQLAKEGMTMLIVTHEMKFAHDVSTRIFFMYDGYIHEDGSPRQIFESPVHSATKVFIQRIRKEVFEIGGPDFDFLGMHSAMAAFCHKYGIAEKQETAVRLTDQMLDGAMAPYRPITVRITHSEQSGITALDFMVEKMTVTPLSDAQRSTLSGQCKKVIEEPTKRGFRVKLII